MDQEKEKKDDLEALRHVGNRALRDLNDLADAEAAVQRYPDADAVFERARLAKQVERAQRTVAAIERGRTLEPGDGSWVKGLDEYRERMRKWSAEAAKKPPERLARMVPRRERDNPFAGDPEVRRMVERRCGQRGDAIGQAVKEYLSDRQYQARAAWDYAKRPTVENEEHYRVTEAACEKKRDALVEKSNGLPKDVADSLWTGIRRLEQDVDWGVAQEYGRRRGRERER